MKRLIEQNYYELLGVSPRASHEEIKDAYEDTMRIYSEESVATYCLVGPEEREELLERLFEAYKTLTNEEARRKYNKSLIKSGEYSVQDLDFVEEPKTRLREVKTEDLIKKDKEEEGNNERHGSRETYLFEKLTYVTGKEIQKVRSEKGIGLEEVYRKTNIPRRILECIEDENFDVLPEIVYLKGFLKAYAKLLGVDQEKMAEGFLKRYEEWKNTSPK